MIKNRSIVIYIQTLYVHYISFLEPLQNFNNRVQFSYLNKLMCGFCMTIHVRKHFAIITFYIPSVDIFALHFLT